MPELTMLVTYAGDISGDFVYVIQRDTDQKFWDWDTGEFNGQPATPYGAMAPVNDDIMRGVYTNGNLLLDPTKFPHGDYTIYVIDREDKFRVVDVQHWSRRNPATQNVTINIPPNLTLKGALGIEGEFE